mmetsp:Transcript_13953/g.16841  ORF Transcript_13953/g.16841 Transcript_13953/m.16841 type:complete len:194 (+) Transcript_13953:296-877(+)|eukprot:CAMPEP_0197853050 /NCGR_PEP_ID=MMETSP1438-20131217/21972_1 /TAXON_ID=1461541 /ORGANISM="Pterosperma sp., Strain CCMP1384" /LENGTH=193 /DNA_ID=CAMNT_0043467321 /DNA_START=275 /DNA_END=856 /DNA_ORIENTATION=-
MAGDPAIAALWRVWAFFEDYGWFVVFGVIAASFVKPHVTRVLRGLRDKATDYGVDQVKSLDEARKQAREKQAKLAEENKEKWVIQERELRAAAVEKRAQELNAKAASIGITPKFGGRKLGSTPDGEQTQSENVDDTNSETPSRTQTVPSSSASTRSPSTRSSAPVRRTGFSSLGGSGPVGGFRSSRPQPRRGG